MTRNLWWNGWLGIPLGLLLLGYVGCQARDDAAPTWPGEGDGRPGSGGAHGDPLPSSPVELADRADQILLVIPVRVEEGELVADVVELIKGPAPAGKLVLSIEPEAAKYWRSRGAERSACVFFAGEYGFVRDSASPASPSNLGVAAFLHEDGIWHMFTTGGNNRWTWVGTPWRGMSPNVNPWPANSVALGLFVKRLLAGDDRPAWPLQTGASWAGVKRVGSVGGRVSGIRVVPLRGDGEPLILVLAMEGDRAFRYVPHSSTFEDVSQPLLLRSHSRNAVVADFDGDGRLDLASWNGDELIVYSQSEEGTFGGISGRLALDEPFVGVSALEVDSADRPAILVCTRSALFLLQLRRDGGFLTEKIVMSSIQDVTPPGAASPSDAPSDSHNRSDGEEAVGPCLAADFNGDAVCDLLQPAGHGWRLFLGKAVGGFREPKRVPSPKPIVLPGRVGDFDVDGDLDVLFLGEQRPLLLANRGGGAFDCRDHLGGVVEEIATPLKASFQFSRQVTLDASRELLWLNEESAPFETDFLLTGHINDDGATDLIWLDERGPLTVFFNWGVGVFGYSYAMNTLGKHHAAGVEQTGLLPQSENGQQAGGLADINQDGAQDLVLVLRDGSVWTVFQEARKGGAR